MSEIDIYIRQLSSELELDNYAHLQNHLIEFSKVIARDCIKIISDERGDLEKAVTTIVENYNLA
jgi:hypothetical protein